MILRSLELEGFRNLRPDRIEFGPRVNLFWGANGAGKTNLLEAVYFLFTTRSFRARSTAEIVAQGTDRFRLAGEVETDSGGFRVQALVGPQGREIWLDGKRAGLEDLLARFPVLAFSSHQMNILRGSPGERRRFLDRGVLGLRPAYLRELGDYSRTLAQRNRLLKASAGGAEREAWDERLIMAGARLMEARRSFCERLSEAVAAHATDLLPAGWGVQTGYRPDAPWDAGTTAQEALAARAARVRGGEERLGHSLFGPHRDDLEVSGGGRDLRRYGSGGQQRSALLALELARMEMMQEARGDAPLLLVDDIDSDLDDPAAHRILDRAGRYQAFVTTCRDDSRDRHRDGATGFEVRGGTLSVLRTVPVSAPTDGDR